MRAILLFFLIIIHANSAWTQTRTTIANGNATNPFTWDCTCIPVPGNNLVINHQLTLDVDFAYTSGTVTINSGAAVTGNSPARILGVGGGSFLNNGTVTVANMYHQAGTFTNNGIMNVANAFGVNLGANSVNNGSVTITDSLYIAASSYFTNNGNLNATVIANAGHFHNAGAYTGTDIWTSGMIMHNAGASFSITNLYNSGSVTSNSPMTISNDLWNSENIDINHNLLIGHSFYNGDTTGGPAVFTNDGIISIAFDFANSKTVNGTGKFCINGSTNNSGAINGTLDFCDLSGGSIDLNVGTVAGTVTFCVNSCNIGVIENETESVTVYPNPFENTFEIRTNKVGSYRVQIVNAIGQEMLDQQFNASVVKLDASSLAAGVYFYRLSLANELVSTGKVIKK